MPGLPPGYSHGGAGGGLTIGEIRTQAPAGALPDPVTSSTALLASDFRTISIVHLERHWSAQADRYPGYTWAQGSTITASDAGDVGNLGSNNQIAVVPLADDVTDFAGSPDDDTPGFSVGDIVEVRKDAGNLTFIQITAIALSFGVRYYSYEGIHSLGALAVGDAVEILRYKRNQGFVPLRGDAADALIKTAAGYAWLNVTAVPADIVAGTSAAKYVTPAALDAAGGWMVDEAEAAWSGWSDTIDYFGLAAIGGRDDITVSNAGVPAGNVALYRTSAWAAAPAISGDTFRCALDLAIGGSRYCVAYFDAYGSASYKRVDDAWADLPGDDPAISTHWLDAVRAKGAWRLSPWDVGYDWGESFPDSLSPVSADFAVRLDGNRIDIFSPVYSTAHTQYEGLGTVRERRPWRPHIVPKAADYQIVESDERDVVLLSDAGATLPPISGDVGQGWSVWIANADSDAATISAGTGQTVDGSASVELAGGKAAFFAVTTSTGYAVLCRS